MYTIWWISFATILQLRQIMSWITVLTLLKGIVAQTELYGFATVSARECVSICTAGTVTKHIEAGAE